MPETNNPHDAFFKEVFTRRDVTRDFLKHYLPPEIVARLNLSTLALVKDSFVDAALQEHFSDLLFKIEFKEGSGAFIYLLYEHKSWPERWAAFQVLRYAVRIWEPLVEQNVKKLPPIFPVILYHGRTHWGALRRFSDLIDWRQAEGLRPYVPEFMCFVLDLTALSEAEIKGKPRLRVALLLMKHVFSKEIGERLTSIFGLLKSWSAKRAEAYLNTIMHYLRKAPQEILPEQFKAGIAAAFHDQEKGKKVMATFTDVWVLQGRQEEAMAIVLKQLKRRFDKVDASVQKQMQSLSVVQIEELSEALLDFRTKEDLLTWLHKHTGKKL